MSLDPASPIYYHATSDGGRIRHEQRQSEFPDDQQGGRLRTICRGIRPRAGSGALDLVVRHGTIEVSPLSLLLYLGDPVLGECKWYAFYHPSMAGASSSRYPEMLSMQILLTLFYKRCDEWYDWSARTEMGVAGNGDEATEVKTWEAWVPEDGYHVLGEGDFDQRTLDKA